MRDKIRILIVDDEQRFLKTISKILELRNFDVTAVSDGESALWAANKNDFDIALIDLRMPGMDGEEVLEKLKEAHPDLEVIILTAHGSLDTTISADKKGAFSFLQKPCELDTLIHVCHEACERRRRKPRKSTGQDTEKEHT